MEKMVALFLREYDVRCREVIIHFVDKKTISKLHKDVFDDPSPTDCISFPIDGPHDSAEGSILGEVFVCPTVALEYVKKRGGDPDREIALYLFHGLLHLIGYDDTSPKERQEMRRQEKRCLKFIPL